MHAAEIVLTMLQDKQVLTNVTQVIRMAIYTNSFVIIAPINT